MKKFLLSLAALMASAIAMNAATTATAKDTYNYQTYTSGDKQFKLENVWVYGRNWDNFEANKPGGFNMCRAMGAQNGIMYFPDRQNMQIVRVDGKTGAYLTPVKLASNVFTEVVKDEAGNESTIKTNAVLLNNDLKFDNAGHMLLGVCSTPDFPTYQVWNVDPNTGEGYLVLQDRLIDHLHDGVFADTAHLAGGRFDYFGVYGDVTADAIIMSSEQFTMNVYKWTIRGGQVVSVEDINCKVAEDLPYYISGVVATGIGPQVFPVDEEYFYVDGFNTFPTLFDMDGELVGDLQMNENGNKVVMDGDTLTLETAHNGLQEFQLGGEYFLLMAAKGTGTPYSSSFVLYKFADAGKEMDFMEPVWWFPHDGLGGGSNEVRTAMPCVEVVDNVANIYLYSQESGFAHYTLTCEGGTALENVEENVQVSKMVRNNQLLIQKNGQIYNALGQQMR